MRPSAAVRTDVPRRRRAPHRYEKRYEPRTGTAPWAYPSLVHRRGRERPLSGLVVELLGPPHVTIDGQPLAVDTRKALAVLAVVATDGPQSRARLATMLWPDSDDTRARSALRRTLSVLNRGVDGRLHADRRSVALAGDDTDVDVCRVATLLDVSAHRHPRTGTCPACVAPLREVVELHRGDFLEDFSVREAPFDDWRAEQAASYRRQLCDCLDRLSQAETTAGELDAALAHAQRWSVVDQLNEAAYRRRMLLHARRGERTEAIRTYRECVAVLDRELGVPPLPATLRCYETVVEGRLPRTATPATTTAVPRPRHAPPGEIPFLGRDDEVQAVRDALAAPGAMVVVTGEAGVGKTRFVEEVEAGLHRQQVAVLTAACHGDRSRVLGPVAELLQAAVGRPETAARLAALPVDTRRDVARLVPGLAGGRSAGPDMPLTDAPGMRPRFLAAVADALDAAIGPGDATRVLILEDVHAADETTLELLTQLPEHATRSGMRMLVTWRPEDVDRTRRVRAATDTLAAAPGGLVVPLARLDAPTVTELCRRMLGRDDVDGIAARLVDESDGLPLAVVEYLHWLEATRAGVEDDWPVPAGVRELLRRRLVDLDPEATQVVSAAAVIGHGFDHALLSRVAGRSEDETVVVIDDLVARGLLRTSPSVAGAFDFSHDKLRAVAYERTGPARRRLLHARVAEALVADAQRPAGSALASTIAEHAHRAGDDTQAVTWWLRAGDDALAVFAHPEARDHYQRALASGHPEILATVHRRLARLESLAGDYHTAMEHLDVAAAHEADREVLAEIERELGALLMLRGRWEAARAHLETGLEFTDGRMTSAAARLLAELGLLELRTSGAEEAAATARRALTVAEASGDLEAMAQARNLAGIVARREGDVRGAQAHLERAAAVAGTLADPSAAIAALNNLALTVADAGDEGRADELLSRALERCVQLGDRHREAALLNNLADLAHRRGDEPRAMSLLKQAVATFAQVGEEGRPNPEIWKLTEW